MTGFPDAKIDGDSYTQLLRLNIIDPEGLRVNGEVVGSSLGGVSTAFNVEDLKSPALAPSGYSLGEVVATQGYFTANDGGGALYRIVPGGTGADDGGSIIDLDNGNQAQLLNLDVNFSMFGAQDNVVSTPQLQACLNYVSSSPAAIKDLTKKTYLFDEGDTPSVGLLVKSDTSIQGNVTLRLADGNNVLSGGVRIEASASNVLIDKGITLDFNRDFQTGSPGNGLIGGELTKDIRIYCTVINCENRSIVANNDGSPPTGVPPHANAGANWDVQARVLNAGDKAIMMLNVRDSTCSNCYVETNITDPANAAGSLFESSQAYNIHWESCIGRHLGDNQTLGPGIRSVNGSNSISYTSCTAEGGRQNILIIDSSDVVIDSCIGRKASVEGCLISSEASNRAEYGFVDNINIVNTLIENCGQSSPNDGILINSTVSNGSLTNINIDNCRIRSDDGNMVFGIDNNELSTVSVPVSVYLWNNNISGQSASRKTEGVFNGIVEPQIEKLWSGTTASISTDSFVTITPPGAGDSGFIDMMPRTAPTLSLNAAYRCAGGLSMIDLSNGGGSVAVTTGPLNGTTGAPGTITYSADNGLIYIENRTGSSRSIDYAFRCAF